MAEIREVIYQHHQGAGQRSIEKSLGISRNSIRKYIAMAVDLGYTKVTNNEEVESIAIEVQRKIISTANSKRPNRSTKELKLFHERIASLLTERWITHEQIHRILITEGLKSSRRSLSRYILRYFPMQQKTTIHLVTKPGQEAQVDYAYVGIFNNKKTYAFIMTLSHSRYRYVEFVHSQDQLSWAQSHINAFRFFGGVPHCILLDNLKSGVIKPDIYDPTINETYAELSRFYSFIADPAKARTPEHKGKVERSVQMVKEQLIAGMNYDDLSAMNDFARNWCANKISHVVCSTTGERPIDLFNNEEKVHLKPLPSIAFDMPIWTDALVHNDHHFVLSGNFYSVPTRYIGSIVQIRMGLKTVQVYSEHVLIKTHVREYRKGQWITDETDYPDTAKLFLENTPSVCIKKAQLIGQATETIVTAILKDGTRTVLRKAQAILRLAEEYSNNRLENACLRAIVFDNYSYKSLKKILEDGLDSKNTKTCSTKRYIALDNIAYIRPANEYSSDMEAHCV
jgi:hypothetical protein